LASAHVIETTRGRSGRTVRRSTLGEKNDATD
jgi:hypothetical protein